MKAYIAGPLFSEKDRKFIEKIAKICEKLGIKTFLPHRDVGLWKPQNSKNFESRKSESGEDFLGSFKDIDKIAKGDLEGFKGCDFLIANLNGFGVGAGTSWEMGYAYAKGIPVLAIKTDRKIQESIEELSAIVVGTTKIVSSLTELENEIKKLIKTINR